MFYVDIVMDLYSAVLRTFEADVGSSPSGLNPWLGHNPPPRPAPDTGSLPSNFHYDFFHTLHDLGADTMY